MDRQMDELAQELTVEMITNELCRHIAGEIGIENLLKLAWIIGGSTVYIPSVEQILLPARNARIKREFNGYNHAALARKYNITERWVRALCGNGCLEEQVSFEDLPPAQ